MFLHDVYSLTDPRFPGAENPMHYWYIGESWNMCERYKHHIWSAAKAETLVDKWILELRLEGLKPGLARLDYGLPEWRAKHEETRLIKEYLAWGAPLLNVHHGLKNSRKLGRRLRVPRGKTHRAVARELEAFIKTLEGKSK